MKHNIKEAFDQVTADDTLRRHTAHAVAEKLQRRSRPSFVRPLPIAAVSACLAILLLTVGYRMYMIPVATISVDINPSIELSVNRFDRIVGEEAFNEDGRNVLASVDLRNMRYTDALGALLSSDILSGYLADNADISITILGDTEERSSKMLNCVRTEPYAQQKNVFCDSGHHEESAAAHAVGLSLGKYRAYLILHELDSTITPDDVRDLSMRAIRLWIEELGGSMPGGYGTGNGAHHNQSNASGNGHTHGNGHS